MEAERGVTATKLQRNLINRRGRSAAKPQQKWSAEFIPLQRSNVFGGVANVPAAMLCRGAKRNKFRAPFRLRLRRVVSSALKNLREID
jgi:hypothetical protein